MSIFKSLTIKGVAIAIAMTLASAAVPQGTPLVGISAAKADPYWRGDRGWRGDRDWRGYRGGWDGPRRSYRHRDRGWSTGGAALAGTIVGLGIGAALASQPRYYEPEPRYYRPAPRYYRPAPRVVYEEPRVIYRQAPRYYSAPRYVSARPAPWSRSWYEYCSSRYRSFDPGSGTFQPYNGPRQFCQ